MPSFIAVLTSTMLLATPVDPLQKPPEKADPTQIQAILTSDNLAAWRDHILPSDGDLAWTKIPWKVTFHEGITAANEKSKPLLLWVMNGHPLGCT